MRLLVSQKRVLPVMEDDADSCECLVMNWPFDLVVV